MPGGPALGIMTEGLSSVPCRAALEFRRGCRGKVGGVALEQLLKEVCMGPPEEATTSGGGGGRVPKDARVNRGDRRHPQPPHTFLVFFKHCRLFTKQKHSIHRDGLGPASSKMLHFSSPNTKFFSVIT